MCLRLDVAIHEGLRRALARLRRQAPAGRPAGVSAGPHGAGAEVAAAETPDPRDLTLRH